MSSVIVNLTGAPTAQELEISAKAAGLSVYNQSSTVLNVFSQNKQAVTSWINKIKVLYPTLSLTVSPIKMNHRSILAPVQPPSIQPRNTNVPWFTVNQVAGIYGFPAPVSTPLCVGIISFGGGIYGKVANTGILTGGDVQNYWTSIGISAASQPKVIVVPILGAANIPSMNDGGCTMENTLDVETIGGACPSSNLTIILYIAPNNLGSFSSALSYIYTKPVVVNGVSYRPSVVSCSWGAPEIYFGSSIIANVNSVLNAMTTNGINFCVASGDAGSNDGVGGSGNYVDYPSSSPYATAVGGTTLVCPYNKYDANTTETAWSSGGGGISTLNPKPSYQSSLNAAGRSTPDIALVANPSTGVIYLVNNVYYLIGGTSVAAPIFAAYLAAINYKTFVNPKLYTAAATCYHDITTGTNGGFSARSGYDNCTGFGTPNGTNLTPYLNPPVIPITNIAVTPSTLNLLKGQTGTVNPIFTPTTATNKTIVWTSSVPAVATVNQSGIVTALSNGSTLVTVTTQDGNKQATSVVRVTTTALSVTLPRQSETLSKGNTKTLTANVSPATASDKTVTWSSSNTKVATVNAATGLVTGVKAGKVTITATTVDGGFKSECAVTVV